MDLFERMTQTGRSHRREISDVLGLGCGGYQGVKPPEQSSKHPPGTSLSSNVSDKEDFKAPE